jgi:hypothetical protein
MHVKAECMCYTTAHRTIIGIPNDEMCAAVTQALLRQRQLSRINVLRVYCMLLSHACATRLHK